MVDTILYLELQNNIDVLQDITAPAQIEYLKSVNLVTIHQTKELHARSVMMAIFVREVYLIIIMHPIQFALWVCIVEQQLLMVNKK